VKLLLSMSSHSLRADDSCIVFAFISNNLANIKSRVWCCWAYSSEGPRGVTATRHHDTAVSIFPMYGHKNSRLMTGGISYHPNNLALQN